MFLFAKFEQGCLRFNMHMLRIDARDHVSQSRWLENNTASTRSIAAYEVVASMSHHPRPRPSGSCDPCCGWGDLGEQQAILVDHLPIAMTQQQGVPQTPKRWPAHCTLLGPASGNHDLTQAGAGRSQGEQPRSGRSSPDLCWGVQDRTHGLHRVGQTTVWHCHTRQPQPNPKPGSSCG